MRRARSEQIRIWMLQEIFRNTNTTKNFSMDASISNKPWNHPTSSGKTGTFRAVHGYIERSSFSSSSVSSCLCHLCWYFGFPTVWADLRRSTQCRIAPTWRKTMSVKNDNGSMRLGRSTSTTKREAVLVNKNSFLDHCNVSASQEIILRWRRIPESLVVSRMATPTSLETVDKIQRSTMTSWWMRFVPISTMISNSLDNFR